MVVLNRKSPSKCTGYLRMFNDVEEDYVLYYFSLEDGILSCFERETVLGSKIGSEAFGDPISMEGFLMETPSKDRILICEQLKKHEVLYKVQYSYSRLA